MSVQYTDMHDDLKNFAANGLFFADSGDTVFLHKKISEEVIDYYEHVGAVAPEVQQKEIGFDERPKLGRGERKLFDTFMHSEFEGAFLGTRNDCSLYETYVSKLAFKKKCVDLSIPTPHFIELPRVRNTLWTKFLIRSHFQEDTEEVVIKSDAAVAGYNTKRLHLSDINTLRSFVPEQGVIVQDERFFAEAWIEGVVFAPSIQFFISDDGVQEISIHNQLFYGDRVTYRGCESRHYLQESVVGKLRKEGGELADAYQKEGYRGHFGLNAVYAEDSGLWWLELNPRRVASSYAFQISKNLKLPRSQPYVVTRMQKERWCGVSLNEIISEMEEVLYVPESKEGIIPYDLNTKIHSSCAFFVTSPNKDKISSLLSWITKNE